MASKNNFLVVSLGVMCLCSSVWPVLGQEECASDVSDCVTVAFDVFTNHAQDIPRVCKATDDFLMCIVEETRTCDPLVAASIKDSMSPMLEIYTAEPYNCELESAKNDALKPDMCSEKMSYCSIFYYQAQSESTVDYNRACGLFEKYLDCMNSNTTGCDTDMKSFIEKHTANATKEFDREPLFCEERLQYPLDEVNANMTSCSEILQNMNIQYAKQDYVCRNFRQYFNCSVQALIHASPRQFQNYIQQVNGVSETFRIRPYFCESDQPCAELFKACNESAVVENMAPCQFMDVYRSCLSNANQFCGEAEYITLATNTQIMIGDLHNKYNCIEENMNKQFKETTPVAEVIDNNMEENNDNVDDNNNNNDDNVDVKNDDKVLPEDTMQNDGVMHDSGDPTPEPETKSNPTKTDSKTEEPHKEQSADVTPETSKTGDVVAEPTDGNVIVPEEDGNGNVEEKPKVEEEKVTKKPTSGNGSSGTKSNSGNGDYDNRSSALTVSFWCLLLTFCLLVIKPRL